MADDTPWTPGEPERKDCTECDQDKPITAFAIRNRRGRRERFPRCKECANADKRAWYERNRAAVIAYQRGYEDRTKRRSWLKTKYGMTPEEFDQMRDVQDGQCAICRGPQLEHYRYLDVDHCHATGRVRGLLCRRCNTVLGLTQEDVELLEAMKEYLG